MNATYTEMPCHSMVDSFTELEGRLWAHQWQLALPIYLCQNSNNVYCMSMNKDTNVNQPYSWDSYMIGDESSLQSFLKCCNKYSKSRNMSSKIKFSKPYSLWTLSFLDTKVTIEKDGSLTTSLFLNHQQHFSI